MLDLSADIFALFSENPDEVSYAIGDYNYKKLKFRNAVKRNIDLDAGEDKILNIGVHRHKDPDEDGEVNKNFPLFSVIFSKKKDTFKVYNAIRVGFYLNRMANKRIENIFCDLTNLISRRGLGVYGFLVYSPFNVTGIEYYHASVPDFGEKKVTNFEKCKELEEELFWFGNRLARPVELLVEHGFFRNVYQYNMINEVHIKNLRRCFQFEKLSILIGTLRELSNQQYIWMVPQQEREKAFTVLKRAHLTLYRNFIALEDVLCYPEDA